MLLESAGKDAMKEFQDIGPSKAAQNLLVKYQIGVVQGYSFNKDADVNVASTDEFKNKKDLSALLSRMISFLNIQPLSSSLCHSWWLVPTSVTDT